MCKRSPVWKKQTFPKHLHATFSTNWRTCLKSLIHYSHANMKPEDQIPQKKISTGIYETNSQKPSNFIVLERAWLTAFYWQNWSLVVLLEAMTGRMVRVIYKPAVNHSHKSPAERGKRTWRRLHFQPVFQINMLMLRAVSFQIPIKAALDVGNCGGWSIRWGSYMFRGTRDFVDHSPSLWCTSCLLPHHYCAVFGSICFKKLKWVKLSFLRNLHYIFTQNTFLLIKLWILSYNTERMCFYCGL